jgi:molecular chaperone DnaJ
MKWRERRPQLADELSRLEGLDPAEILQVPPEASFDEIRGAYRRLARVYHPDKSDPFMKKHNEQVMKLINDAYQRLMDKYEGKK